MLVVVSIPLKTKAFLRQVPTQGIHEDKPDFIRVSHFSVYFYKAGKHCACFQTNPLNVKIPSRWIFMIFLPICWCTSVEGQFYVQDFDTTTTPALSFPGITFSASCYDTDEDYIAIISDTDTDETLVGASNQFLAAQDTDDPQCAGSNILVTLEDIDIMGQSNMTMCFDIAEGGSSTGSSEDWDANTSVSFSVSIDGGMATTIVAVEASEDSNNVAPGIDCDLNGIGEDGPEVTETFTTYCIPFLGSGSNLDIIIEMSNLTAGDEDIAIDNVSLFGDGTSPVSYTHLTLPTTPYV